MRPSPKTTSLDMVICCFFFGMDRKSMFKFTASVLVGFPEVDLDSCACASLAPDAVWRLFCFGSPTCAGQVISLSVSIYQSIIGIFWRIYL